MVEIENKYKIYEKKFGYVNWIGFWTLYKKETYRFLIVAIQTVISPLVTSLLFLLVLSLAIGNDGISLSGRCTEGAPEPISTFKLLAGAFFQTYEDTASSRKEYVRKYISLKADREI